MYRLTGGGKKVQWNVFRHNGPYFPPEYIPHNIPVKIDGKKIKLSKIAEEYLTIYANYLDTEYVKNYKFNQNFIKDFNLLTNNSPKLSSMDNIDLKQIKLYIDKQKKERKERSKEEKERIKNRQTEIEEPYKYCVINGAKQKVGNFKIEPPGIFLGRGNHPKIGKIKSRIFPEDVIINLDKNAPIPKPNIGGRWKKVIHNRQVIWLATWTDIITNKNKYVFTSMESIFKSKSDEKKFDLARRLKRIIKKIRDEYTNDLTNYSETKRQMATALYLIDNLALRVGGKKNTKEKADTVGVTSLRFEHISFSNGNIVKLNFLGKDSIRFCKNFKVSDIIFRNLKNFTSDKNKKDDLFHKINSSTLNQYLESFMKGLTAKVWRTYNASNIFQKELLKIKEDKIYKLPESERMNQLIAFFNQANTEVAILCNHQKNTAGDIKPQLNKLDEQISKLRKSKKKNKGKKDIIQKLNAKITTLTIKKETKQKMKNVSLGTSKNNYIDPRIIFAFIKKFNIPKEKLFNQALLKRFEWAQDVSKDFKF